MSKKLKLSPWHDGSVKPDYAGVYQRDYSGVVNRYDAELGIVYSLFRDGIWYIYGENVIDASKATDISHHQNAPWRGVLK